LIQLAVQLTHPQGIRQLSHLAHTLDSTGQFARIQLQASHQCRCQTISGGRFKIRLIGGKDLIRSSLECRSHGLYGLPAHGITEATEPHGRSTHSGGPLQQIGGGIGNAHRRGGHWAHHPS
jgi:hypothetical protein